MKIAIYQVNVDRDDNQVCFCGRKELEARQGTDQIDASLYDKVWEGEMACYTLDGVYCKCNTDPPLNYKTREMSVSDVVEVCDDDGPEPKGFYFCDTNEFTEIPFDKEQTMDARPPTMEVVLVDPGKAPQVVEIGKTYDDLHRVIGGYLECVDLEPNVCLICDEEGKMKEREPNRALYDGDGDVMDVVFGRFFLCDGSTDSFESLPKDKQKEYLTRFAMPERFQIRNGRIDVTAYSPKPKEHSQEMVR